MPGMKGEEPMNRHATGHRRRRSRASCAIVAFMMLLSLWGGMSWNMQEASAASRFDKIMDPELPSDFDADDTTNPYNNSKQKFLLAENNELTVYKSWDVGSDDTSTKNRWVSTFDNYTPGGSMKLMTGDNESDAQVKGGWEKVTADTSGQVTALNYLDSVAFDPNGTGRKDHIAYVGYYNGGNYLLVYDTVKKTWTTTQDLPGTYDANGLNYLISRSFYSITAGDYNGDGRDTIVVYVPSGGNSYGVAEYSYSKPSAYGKLELMGNSKRMLHGIYRQHSEIAQKTGCRDKLGCNLTTGDFDGDGIDDLGVISFGQEYSSAPKDADHRLYTPMVAAVFGDDHSKDSGGSSWSVVSSGKVQTTYTDLNKTREKINKKDTDVYESMRSPSISAGDIDGNGVDELVCSGFWCRIQDDGDTTGYNKGIDHGKITAAAVSATRNSINISGHQMSSNKWTQSTTARDEDYDVKVQISTECVAINGQRSAEHIFINGSLYEYSGASFTEVYTPEYFTKEDKGIGGSFVGSAGITDVVSGVFDGNDQGREQVMFVSTLREKKINYNDYYMTMGAIGGSKYDKETNIAGSYYDSNLDRDHYTIANKGDDVNNKRVNLCIAASDNDNDGLLGSFRDKKCIYTDPKNAAVLQAGPYFGTLEDLGGYDDPCETSYSLSTSFERGTSSGDSVSFGTGISGSLEISAAASLEISLQLGYSLDWNKTFEESVTESYKTSFTAQGHDQVIVSRIPVTVYRYDIYTPKAGGGYTVNEDGYSVSVPGKPVYFQMGISEYNEFVDEYNSKIDELSKDDEPKLKLKKISKDGSDLPDDNEGNPQNYWASWAAAGEGATNLSRSPLALTYNSGHSSSEWSTSTSATEATEMSHGFSFDSTLMAGAGIFGNNVKAGSYVSLEYMHSKGSFTTETEEKGSSGQVENLNEKTLMASGLPKSVIRAYGFNWEFGTWKRELTTKSGDYTPFFGYRVWNVKMPPQPPENLEADNSDTDGLHSVDLTWDPVDSKLVRGYNIYIKDGGEYRQINTELVKDTKYTVSDLDTNTNYIFVVTTEACTDVTGQDTNTTANSVWSEEASITTPRQGYHITLTHDRGSVITATGAEKEIQSGDEVFEGDAVSIKARASEGYTITQILLKKADGSELDITSTDGMFSFVVKGDTEVIVRSKKNVSESEIIYSASEHGSIVSAASGGQEFKSGAMVSDDVTFKAKADEGYVLKEWQITTGSSTQTFAANGSSTYSFGPFAAKHEVRAVFTTSDDPAVTRTITVDSSKGGSIRISDNDGNVYGASEGKVTVNVGTPLKITAVPDKHYVLRAWAGDFASVSAETTEISHTIYEDLTAGAVFFAPVKYKVSYSVNDPKLGSIDTDIGNGSIHVEDTKLTFKATPSDGARLEYWLINKGGTESKIMTKELKSSYEMELDVENTTHVTACFTPVEKYSLTIKTSDQGRISASDQKGRDLADGDTISYGDILKFEVSPADGYEFKALKINGEESKTDDSITVYSDITAEAEYIRIAADKDGNPAADVNVKLSPASAKYTGKAIRPAVAVTVGGKTLTAGTDYTVSYESNIAPGTGYAVITFKGAYKGTIKRAFTIKENTALYKSGLDRKLRITTKSTKVSVKWGKAATADGYDVFLTKCGTDFSRKPSVTTKKQAVSVAKVRGKKVSSSQCYKAYVKAYRMVKGKKQYIATSAMIHSAGSRNKYTNASGITGVPDTKVLKTGKTYQLKAKIKKADKKKPLIKKVHSPWLRYGTTDSAVAKVSSSGKITAAGKGTCTIYVIAPDGVRKTMKITVK